MVGPIILSIDVKIKYPALLKLAALVRILSDWLLNKSLEFEVK